MSDDGGAALIDDLHGQDELGWRDATLTHQRRTDARGA